MNTSTDSAQTLPWWKYRHMWLVVGGPLIVVIASFITLYLALSTPDPVYTDQSGSLSAEEHGGGKVNLTPAMQARNHAATGGFAPSAAAAPASAAVR